MYRNPTSGFWEEDFRRKGLPRLHVSYGVKKKDEAEAASQALHRVYRERRADLIHLLKSGDVKAQQVAGIIADDKPLGSLTGEAAVSADAWPLLGAAAESYIEWLSKSDKRSKKTAVTALSEINRFVKFVGPDIRVDLIPASQITAFQAQLYADEYAQNTIVTTMWRVSGLFTWLQKQEKKAARDERRVGRSLPSPVDAEDVTTRKTKRERFLSEPEAERLLAATPVPLLAAVMVGLLAGLRVDEMLHLRPQHDVDLQLNLITIQEQPTWHPKNRKRRMVPVAPQLRPVLEYHLKHFASERWLFPSPALEDRPWGKTFFYDHFDRIVENAELVLGIAEPEGVVYHTLRHTFASWLVMEGVDLYTVSRLLGNSLKMIEDTYAHLAPDFRQRAAERLGGRVAARQLPVSPPQIATVQEGG